MSKPRLTPAQTKMMSWATSIGRGTLVCPPGPDSGRKATLNGRDDIGRLRVLHGQTTAYSLVRLGLLRQVQGERHVFELVEEPAP